jgi:hypothetical protein
MSSIASSCQAGSLAIGEEVSNNLPWLLRNGLLRKKGAAAMEEVMICFSLNEEAAAQ